MEGCNGSSGSRAGIHISNHPVLLHKLSIMRRKDTTPRDYRSALRELTLNLGYEATADLSLKTCTGETTLGPFEGKELSDNVALIPIMRSGLGMVEPMLELLPSAAVYHIGMYKNRKSVLPVQYFNRLPKVHSCDTAVVLDPSISTAGTVVATVSILKKWGARRVKVVCALAAAAGVAKLLRRHPDVEIYAAAQDEAMNEDGLPVPGIGDAGDRLFSTPYEVMVGPVELGANSEAVPESPEPKRAKNL